MMHLREIKKTKKKPIWTALLDPDRPYLVRGRELIGATANGDVYEKKDSYHVLYWGVVGTFPHGNWGGIGWFKHRVKLKKSMRKKIEDNLVWFKDGTVKVYELPKTRRT